MAKAKALRANTLKKESKDPKFLLLTTFISGMSIMSLEMSASRLIAPYFGTSLFVWTNIIGVTMISLSLGYYYGGKIVDKRPFPDLLFGVILATGVFSVLIPFIAPRVMELSVRAINTGNAGIFYGSLLGTVLLFMPPITALAAVAPFIIRLTTKDSTTYGFTAGRIFAFSTVGSIIGTFLPVLLFIPLIGTKNTILIFGFILTFLGLFGLGKKRIAGFAVLILLLALFTGSARNVEGAILERESVHNYIQVLEKDGVLYLKLNEGYAYHSIYNPESIIVNGVWDYFNLLPLINPGATNALIIGLAGGTVAREYRYFFPYIMIDGVEIDGDILQLAEEHFDMKGENLKVHHMDGRSYLSTTQKKYDIIIIDAYKQPYIPFHLTTLEFFTLIRNHLNKDGIVAINVASLGSDENVLRMIENTMARTFKKVYVFNPPGTLNHIVFASQKELSFEVNPGHPILKKIADQAKEGSRPVFFDEKILILTDDRAPVEMYTDLMIFNYLLKDGDTREYTQLFE
jgi:predicted membrane-bound spermidine synthase